ncbi:RNA-binding S4 domain-containing protein [Piscinibacter koreensis]|uniref:RNA-binding S4 domain-containing protein n=1 Tax=Piscinibacter koreensis TaxID=2742824 RepID=A0A7Y6TUN3_9BURK|nr:RNA-binding S4 domain-containing protein [Schlegelella koreensis]NUZ04158.1 RNA-binding S4 domain-containing protein [Schlegelella koreensis]
MEPVYLDLRGEHIALDALLKACGIASSGGNAKALIAAGEVMVNGEVEMRRGRKLRVGDDVRSGPHLVRVRAAA